MDTVLRGLKNVFCFSDDVLVASKTPEQHHKDLSVLFDLLKKQGILVSMKKCKLFKDNITFLGFEVSKNGTSIPEDKVKAVIAIQLPVSTKALYAWLGYFNYYMRFVKNFATLAQPLYAAADYTKSKKVNWTPEVLNAFENVKTPLPMPPN